MPSLKHILRRLARSPGFTLVAVLTLALGIGANTAIFSVVNSVLLKPLPYPQAESLTGVWHLAPGLTGITGDINCSPTMFYTYREQNQTFEHFGIWSNGGATITGLADPEQVRSILMTHGVLDALGVQPLLGRWFSEAEALESGGPNAVILTNAYWKGRLGGDSNVIGRTLIVDGKPRSIVGVMPADFRFLNADVQILMPHQFEKAKLYLGNFSFQGIARLKPGVTLEQANADVGRMLPLWLNGWPAPPGFTKDLFGNARLSAKIQPLKQEVVGDIGNSLWVLMGTIGMVLLIACANVANLLLVRADGRQHEIAIRSALGASRSLIMREMFLESLILGLAGGLVGLALAYGGLRVLVAAGPATLPRLQEIAIDPVALAFTLVASLMAALLFGVVPVLKYATPQVASALRAGGRGMSHSRERHRARNTLVVTQVALAMVLLVGSGLMIRTFRALHDVRVGFDRPEQIQLVRTGIPEAQIKNREQVVRAHQAMLEKITAIPGVKSVSFGNGAPLEGQNSNDLVYVRDKVYENGQIPPIRRFRFIAPGYHQTLGTGMVAGREFTWTDIYDQRLVAMVSNNMAREMWGSPEKALGKYVREGMNDPWREVVGVVSDLYDDGVHRAAPVMVYWPVIMDHFWGDPGYLARNVTFIIRTDRAGTESLLTEVRQAIWSVNNNLPVFLVRTLDEVYSQSMARTSFTLVLLGIAGGMALLLGIIGIYGVISYAVTQRTREIGIRIALGAEPTSLKAMFVRQGLLLAAIGVVLGLALSAGLARWMATLLYGVKPLDPLTFGAVPLVLVLAVIAASYIPARRTTKVDPMIALRAD